MPSGGFLGSQQTALGGTLTAPGSPAWSRRTPFTGHGHSTGSAGPPVWLDYLLSISQDTVHTRCSLPPVMSVRITLILFLTPDNNAETKMPPLYQTEMSVFSLLKNSSASRNAPFQSVIRALFHLKYQEKHSSTTYRGSCSL